MLKPKLKPNKPGKFPRLYKKIMSHNDLPSLHNSKEFNVLLNKSKKHPSLETSLLSHQTIEEVYNSPLFTALISQLNPNRTQSAVHRSRSVVKETLDSHIKMGNIYAHNAVIDPVPENKETIKNKLQKLSGSNNASDHKIAVTMCTNYFKTNNPTGIKAFNEIASSNHDLAIDTLTKCFKLNLEEGINIVKDRCESESDMDTLLAVCIFLNCFFRSIDNGVTKFKSLYLSDNPKHQMIVVVTLVICLNENIKTGIEELRTLHHSNNVVEMDIARKTFLEAPNSLTPNSKEHKKIMGRTFNIATNPTGMIPTPPQKRINPSKSDETDGEESTL